MKAMEEEKEVEEMKEEEAKEEEEDGECTDQNDIVSRRKDYIGQKYDVY